MEDSCSSFKNHGENLSSSSRLQSPHLKLLNLIYKYWEVGRGRHLCHKAFVEVRGQLCAITFLFLPFCESWGGQSPVCLFQLYLPSLL